MIKTGFIPFYIQPTNRQIVHIKAWINEIHCCAVVTSKGVHYVGESEAVTRLTCFLDGFNYMAFKCHK